MYHDLYPLHPIPYENLTLENICGYETHPACYWAPRRIEIQRFVEIAQAVNGTGRKPTIVDVGCGTGLFAYLLARTGQAKVVGIDPDERIIRETPYHHANLQLLMGDAEDAVRLYRDKNIDMVINSWMPMGMNLTPALQKIKARSIAYVLEKSGATGDEDKSYEPGRQYYDAFTWHGPSLTEVQFISLPYPQTKSGDGNKIRIQLRRDILQPIISPIKIPSSERYAWETGLRKAIGPVKRMRIL